MRSGDKIRLPGTLAIAAGYYTVVSILGEQVTVRSSRGEVYTLTRSRFWQLVEEGASASCTPLSAHLSGRDHGVLSAMGYKVGKDGIASAQRHLVLQRVFKTPNSALPAGEDRAYRSEWNAANSSGRLQKMNNCLASFVSLHWSRRAAFRQAIEAWQTDLAWLHDELYMPNKFTFPWAWHQGLRG